MEELEFKETQDPKRSFVDAKLLNRERKVKNREEKELRRGGTKHLKHAAHNGYVDMSNWQNRIICGDSEEVLKKIPDSSVDLIITSPPYNFGLDYKDDMKEDSVNWNEYFEKIGKIWKECERVLKSGGRLCLVIQPLFSDYNPTHHRFSQQLIELGLLWKGEILWDKHNYNCKYTAWGSWKSPSMPYFKYTWEFIEVFSKDTHKKTGNIKDIDIKGEEFKKWVYVKWDIAPEMRMKEFDHPAMFPEEVPNRLIKLLSYKNDIVLDPFNGVGTTTLVAKKLGRKFIGIDVSEKYCKTALERLKKVEIPLHKFMKEDKD